MCVQEPCVYLLWPPSVVIGNRHDADFEGQQAILSCKFKGTVARNWDGKQVTSMDREYLEDQSLKVLKLSVGSWFFLSPFRSQRYCKNVTPLYGNGTILLLMSLEIIQYTLLTALEGEHYLLASGYWRPSDKCITFARFQTHWGFLPGGCHCPLTPSREFNRGLPGPSNNV